VTATNKVNKVELRRAGFRTDEPVWWTPERGTAYRPFTTEDRTTLLNAYTAHGRENALDL
ncbi:acyl-CoA synthetase, partial [Streptodolium elevatio]